MDIFGNLATGIANVLTPMNLLLLLAGVMVGMIVGVMPGLGPSAALAILLPLTFTLDPAGAIVMLAAVYYGAMYGGTITSVLINTPGESATVASTFDGYPLAKQGRAGPALVMAAIASFVAGTIGAILISFAAPGLADVASNFGPPELFLLVIAGLIALVVIIGKNRLLGALSALLGFALATVGPAVGTGEQRYTFDMVDLIDGIDFVPVAIGLFGLGEIFYTLYKGGHLERLGYFSVSVRDKGFWPNKKDFKETKWSMLRGSILGFFVGTAPGAGATVASLMSYSIEKAVSKTPQRFGKGMMAGLVGPEAANNAASAGAMIPLLVLGIPGSAATAVLLGGFLMWDLEPGPLLMTDNPEFAWSLIGSMYLGNVMLLVVNIFFIPAFASIARVPFKILAPVVIVLCVLGTFAVNSSFVEVGIMLACGVLGFFMRRFGLSPAALVVALVLGQIAEQTLRQTMIISRGSFEIFVTRSQSLILIGVIVLLILVPIFATRIGRSIMATLARNRAGKAEESAKTRDSDKTGV